MGCPAEKQRDPEIVSCSLRNTRRTISDKGSRVSRRDHFVTNLVYPPNQSDGESSRRNEESTA
jgi:hypothetical protein